VKAFAGADPGLLWRKRTAGLKQTINIYMYVAAEILVCVD
jgi:hypothetical protein